MKQLPLPGMEHSKIVNVASVPFRSPFRYPGGKTWLVPTIRNWLKSLNYRPHLCIEPFAGGAIVGLTTAFEALAEHIVLVELDECVASVWQTIIEDGNAEWLAKQIENFELTLEQVDSLLAKEALTSKVLALQTVVRNRVNRGGILAHGAGRIRQGENNRGIASRWYPATLKQRILDIDRIKQRLTFVHGDGLEVVKDYLSQRETVFFVDPPYTASKHKPGKRLYDYFEVDHEQLFALMSQVKGDFIMTYDNDEYVRVLANQFGFDVKPIAMRNTHNTRQTELIIGRNLDWL